ncbi:MAG TPA: tetratricopeptide repeat protein [Candidatus Angelobacter sp.]
MSRFAGVSDVNPTKRDRAEGRQAKSRHHSSVVRPQQSRRWFIPLLAPLAFIFLSILPLSIPLAAEQDARWLLQNGRANQALQVLNARIQKNPNDAQAYNLMARVYFQLEHWDDAIHAAEKSVALAPDVSEYHQWLARACGEKAEAAGAVSAFNLVRRVKSEFEKAVALDPDGKNVSARVDLAEFYIEAPYMMGGDKTKARRLADSVMQRDPAVAHYILGKLEEKQNGKNHAEQEYRASIETSGNLARYWVNLGSFYRHIGRLDDMESAVNKSLTAKQEDGVYLFDGASLLLNAGRNFPQAIQMLHRYLSLDDPAEDGPAFQAHYLLGSLLEKQGDTKAAALEYRAALALASEYKPAQDALARLSR